MRYAESKYGEYATALGEFTTGRTITIEVYNAATGAPVGLSSASCTEIGTTGVYRWSTSNISSQPVGYTELLYIMTDVTPVVGTGRTHKGKIIIGGYPSNSAKGRFRDGYVYIDTVNGTDGTAYPNGTEYQPCKTIANVVTIAGMENLTKLKLRGSITLGSDFENWSIDGFNPDTDIITASSGFSVDGTRFERVGIRGDLEGHIACEQCLIGVAGGTITGLSGTFTQCGFDGRIKPFPATSGGKIKGLNLASQNEKVPATGISCILDYDGEDCRVIGELKGFWKIVNMTGSATSVLAFALSGAYIEIDSSCDAGIYMFLGNGELDNNLSGPPLFWYDAINRGTDTQMITADSVVDITADPFEEQWTRQTGPALFANTMVFQLFDESLAPLNSGNPITGKYVRARTKP